MKDSTAFYAETPRSITFRTHEQQSAVRDPLLDMTPVPLTQLQAEFCPRISAADMLLLLQTPDRVAVVDIRNIDEHCAETVPGSISIPFNLIALSEHQVIIFLLECQYDHTQLNLTAMLLCTRG